MKKKGFTLLELMISLAVFSIFAGFMYRSFYEEIRATKTVNNRSDLQYNAGKAIELISTEVRNGGTITLNGNKVVGTVPAIATTLVDLSGTGTGSDINLDTIGKSLKDNQGRILCKNIDSVQISTTGVNGVMLNITANLSEGQESYKVVTAINLKDTRG